MDNTTGFERKVKFMTIRQTANQSGLSHALLRKMGKEGKLPCIYSGNRCLINYDALMEQLDNESRESVR